jgi:hypothetical protein
MENLRRTLNVGETDDLVYYKGEVDYLKKRLIFLENEIGDIYDGKLLPEEYNCDTKEEAAQFVSEEMDDVEKRIYSLEEEIWLLS